MGIAVWPMVELEADDGLASAAHIASGEEEVEKVCIWTPDKDLAQCVRDDRVVQVDRKAKKIFNAEGVRAKFGVEPALIPDYLALIGDSADGYPGISGIGPATASRLLEPVRAASKNSRRVSWETAAPMALLFKQLATLRTDAPLFQTASELRWRGPTSSFPAVAERLGDPKLVERCQKAEEKIRSR